MMTDIVTFLVSSLFVQLTIVHFRTPPTRGRLIFHPLPNSSIILPLYFRFFVVGFPLTELC